MIDFNKAPIMQVLSDNKISAPLFASITTILLCIVMSDMIGWLLIFFSFPLIFSFNHFIENKRLAIVFLISLLTHQFVTIINGYSSYLWQFGQDFNTFHLNALHNGKGMLSEINFTSSLLHQNYYEIFLTLVYWSLGQSKLLGGELSIYAYLFSSVILLKISDYLGLREFRVGIIIVFGMLPSLVLYRSLTAREPWQMLFFLLSLYLSLKTFEKLTIFRVVSLLISLFIFAHLHYTFKKFSIILVILIIFCHLLFYFQSRQFINYKKIWIVLLILVSLSLPMKSTFLFKTFYTYIIKNIEYANHVRSGVIDKGARSTYSIPLRSDSLMGVVKTYPSVFLHYMFSPFPWQIHNFLLKDYIAAFESILRFVLFLFALLFCFNSSGVRNNYCIFLLIAFLLIEIMWSFGSSNVGTAVRHRAPAFGVLILLGYPGMHIFFKKFFLLLKHKYTNRLFHTKQNDNIAAE